MSKETHEVLIPAKKYYVTSAKTERLVSSRFDPVRYRSAIRCEGWPKSIIGFSTEEVESWVGHYKILEIIDDSYISNGSWVKDQKWRVVRNPSEIQKSLPLEEGNPSHEDDIAEIKSLLREIKSAVVSKRKR